MPISLVYSTVAPVSHKTCYEFMRSGLLVRPQVTEYGFKIMSLVVSIYELTSSGRSNIHFVGKCSKSCFHIFIYLRANMGILCLPCWYSLVLTTLSADRSRFDSANPEIEYEHWMPYLQATRRGSPQAVPRLSRTLISARWLYVCSYT
jgi:hypothetical protein